MPLVFRDTGYGIQVGMLVEGSENVSNCLLCMFLFEQFLHTCLHLVDQVLHSSWLAPSRSCMSAQLLLADCPCQLGCTYKHCMFTYELSNYVNANRLCYKTQDSRHIAGELVSYSWSEKLQS